MGNRGIKPLKPLNTPIHRDGYLYPSPGVRVLTGTGTGREKKPTGYPGHTLLLPSQHRPHSLPHSHSTHSIPAMLLYIMSQTSMNTPKVMPSYSSLWEARITNLCHPHLIQMQRCPAPPMPAAPSTTMVSCSPLHPEMFPWALRLQTTSPSEMSSQSTTCPMEKPSNGSMTQQVLHSQGRRTLQ